MQRWIDSTRAASSTGSLSRSTLPPSRSNRHDRDLLDSVIDELPAL
ncbi:hypothetical protein [Rhodococcus wratislaviensis]|nr:hypothetical protein [Rhodococcus wratislaviensis]